MIEFKFLPILTQGLPYPVFERRSRCMNGHHACTALSVITQLPGSVACIASTYASLIELGMTIRSCTHTVILHMKVVPVAVYVWANLSIAFLVRGVDTISHFFKYCIFRRQSGHEGA